MNLLIGLIAMAVAFALGRAFWPQRQPFFGLVAGVAGATLLVVERAALLTLQFWAGLIGFIAILSALLVILHPNPMVSVLFLILNLFCVALFYLFLQAQFLAAIQIIVYAGAIMVLFLFVIMLLNLRVEEGLHLAGGVQRPAAFGLGAAFAGILFWAIQHRRDRPFLEPPASAEGFGTARDLGTLLFGRYLFAFEAASILLVAAMIGAVLLAKRRLQ
jgi:NADH-quinone oxidoreductase subunit J